MSQHHELIETAAVEYLKAISPSPWSSDLSSDDGLRIFSGESEVEKDGACIVCVVTSMADEDPPLSGNRWSTLSVNLYTPVVAPDETTESSATMDSHKANASALETAMLSTTLPDDLSAAIAGFTCFGFSNRSPVRRQEDAFWMSGWNIQIYSCPSTLA